MVIGRLIGRSDITFIDINLIAILSNISYLKAGIDESIMERWINKPMAQDQRTSLAA
jgi:hypothetical protein